MTETVQRTGRRFELLRELGAGTFGTVYLADMVSLGDFRKRVALKVLNAEWAAGSDAGIRLRDEARLLGQLRHRHIVSVDDLVLVGGRWGVVMEYVNGIDLEQLVAHPQAPACPPAAALEIVAAICDALSAAHRFAGPDGQPLNVVHRDIKPSNVLLTAQGDVKVLDFGIARAQFASREAKTGRIRFGSVPYMSPERILGDEEVIGGDVYAVGCVLFELLTQTRFIRRDLKHAVLGPEQHAAYAEERLNLLPGKDLGIRDFIADCVRYDVEDRPAPEDLVDRALQIARDLDSQHLRAFAAVAVPQVKADTDQQTSAIQGVLSEERFTGTSRAVNTSAAHTNNPTLSFDKLDELPDDDELNQEAYTAATLTRPQNRRFITAIGVIAGVFLAMLLGGGGYTAYTTLNPPEPPPAPPLIDLEPPPNNLEIVPTKPAPPAPEPAPDPDPDPDPTVETPSAVTPEPEPIDPEPLAAPVVTPKPTVTPKPEPVVVAPVPTPEPEAAVERLRAVKFSAPAGATGISARCGDVSGSGTGSVNLRNLPAGRCIVTATTADGTLKTGVMVTKAAGYRCSIQGAQLSCQ